MRILIALALLFTSIVPSIARDVYVRGYYRSNGTYVQPHYRSSPNNTTLDNFSVRGNPYTGARGSNSFGSSYGSGPNLYGGGSGPSLNLYGGSGSRRW